MAPLRRRRLACGILRAHLNWKDGHLFAFCSRELPTGSYVLGVRKVVLYMPIARKEVDFIKQAMRMMFVNDVFGAMFAYSKELV